VIESMHPVGATWRRSGMVLVRWNTARPCIAWRRGRLAREPHPGWKRWRLGGRSPVPLSRPRAAPRLEAPASRPRAAMRPVRGERGSCPRLPRESIGIRPLAVGL